MVFFGVPLNHPYSIGISLINHPFWGTPIYGNLHMVFLGGKRSIGHRKFVRVFVGNKWGVDHKPGSFHHETQGVSCKKESIIQILCGSQSDASHALHDWLVRLMVTSRIDENSCDKKSENKTIASLHIINIILMDLHPQKYPNKTQWI